MHPRWENLGRNGTLTLSGDVGGANGAQESTPGRGDEDLTQLRMVPEMAGHLLDGHVGPERARPLVHGLLGPAPGIATEVLAPEEPEHDAAVVDHDAEGPVAGPPGGGADGVVG